jgi:hypothetical protein
MCRSHKENAPNTGCTHQRALDQDWCPTVSACVALHDPRLHQSRQGGRHGRQGPHLLLQHPHVDVVGDKLGAGMGGASSGPLLWGEMWGGMGGG